MRMKIDNTDLSERLMEKVNICVNGWAHEYRKRISSYSPRIAEMPFTLEDGRNIIITFNININIDKVLKKEC
jgi:hypothetical protein